jgi:hypothetical protein
MALPNQKKLSALGLEQYKKKPGESLVDISNLQLDDEHAQSPPSK